MFKLKSELLDSWTFFKNNLVEMSLIVLPIIIPLEIATLIYVNNFTSDLYSILVPMLIGFLLLPVYVVGIIFFISSVVDGDPIDRNEAWKFGIKYWIPFIGLIFLLVIASMIVFMISIATVLGFLILFGAVTLSGLVLSMGSSFSLSDMSPLFTITGSLMGVFILCIFVLGIVLIIRWSAFSGFDLLFNKSTLIGSLKNSWSYTRNCVWRLFFGYIIVYLILIVPSYLLLPLFDSSSVLYNFISVIVNLAFSVFFILFIVFSFRIYDKEVNKT